MLFRGEAEQVRSGSLGMIEDCVKEAMVHGDVAASRRFQKLVDRNVG